jgi:hypothetical protein
MGGDSRVRANLYPCSSADWAGPIPFERLLEIPEVVKANSNIEGFPRF